MTDVVDSSNGEPDSKKPKLSESTVKDVSGLYNPGTLKFVKVIRNDTKSKCIILHCHVGEEDAIVLLQKTPFPQDGAALREAGLVDQPVDGEGDGFVAETLQSNDIYHRLLVSAGLEKLGHVNVTVIHPAGPTQFEKYSRMGSKLVQETPQMYKERVLPYLAERPRDLTWVTNILDGTAERDRVLFEDADEKFGFSMVLDFRWDGRSLADFHCLGIAKDASLTCLRDLRAEHVPMLRRLADEGRALLAKKYAQGTDHEKAVGLQEDDIVVYFHYPPSFYHLHVHFTHISGPDEGGTRAGRAHLLDEVIRNLELSSTFYADRTITATLGANSLMLKALRGEKVYTD